jgi:SH3-like domain-containing protein
MRNPKRAIITTFCIVLGTLVAAPVELAASAHAASNGPSGLPLPRFVSLKAQRVNMRVGPGRDYKVEWMYTKRGLPLEILQEYDNWRKVRDSEGEEGWILQSLLSGERTALVTPWKAGEANALISLRKAPDYSAPEAALLEPGVLAAVDECVNGWCKVSVNKVDGYAAQTDLWGVYPDETIE